MSDHVNMDEPDLQRVFNDASRVLTIAGLRAHLGSTGITTTDREAARMWRELPEGELQGDDWTMCVLLTGYVAFRLSICDDVLSLFFDNDGMPSLLVPPARGGGAHIE